jgi:pimeloyl-ACP methyl ester carboxylesterase
MACAYGMLLAASPASGGSLTWNPCREPGLEGIECGTLTVPKVYGDSGVGTFHLAVARLPATGSGRERIGSLIFNPGGPGESGIDLVGEIGGALGSELRRHFDFVVWDPRGVGRSSGLSECTGGEFAPPATGPVKWAAILNQMRQTQAAANAACEARYPDVLPYISTNATVRDLERLRAAVGDKKLTYWGTSYGTRIGYLYARAYPERVRAMLLSSSVNPNGSWHNFVEGAGAATDSALGLLFTAFPESANHYRSAMGTLAEHALPLPSGTVFTQWHARAMLLGWASSEGNYPTAASFLETVDSAVNGSGRARAKAIRALDELMDWPARFPMRGGATAFIGCLDYADRIERTEQDQIARHLRAQAPITGWFNSQALFYCQGMTVTPDPVPVDIGSNWQTPMLIVGSTRDALTPYAWTIDMARTFRNSRVVTYIGAQHTPFLGAGSQCVDQYGIDYLVSLERPSMDVACPSVVAAPEERTAP